MAHVSALGNLRRQPSATVGLGPRLLGALLVLEAWLDRRCQRQALRELDDHMLRDIGVSRAAADHEAGKPLWR